MELSLLLAISIKSETIDPFNGIKHEEPTISNIEKSDVQLDQKSLA